MASKGDKGTVGRAKSGSDRKREGDATRISLLDSFNEWKSQKAEIEAQLRRLKEAIGLEPQSRYMKTTMTHAEFACHLLQNHKSSCHFCRTRKSSDDVDPVAGSDRTSKILASYRPIRSKEFTTQSAPGTVNGNINLITQPSPVRNQNDEINPQTCAASMSSNEVLATQKDASKTCVEVKEEREEGGDKGPGEAVQMKETQTVGDSLNFQDKESHEKDTDVEAEEGIEIILNDDVDGGGYSSEKDEGIEEKRQKLDHQVTDSSIRSAVAAVARVVEVHGGTGNSKYSDEESNVLGVTDSVGRRGNVTIFPKPVGNESDASKVESEAASASVNRTVAPQEDVTETDHEELQEQEAEDEKKESCRDEGDLKKVQGEAEVEEATSREELVALCNNIDLDETDMVESDIGQMGHEAESNLMKEGGIKVDRNVNDDDEDNGDEEKYSSEEDESPKEKMPKLDHQVTDLPFKTFDVAEVAKAEGFSGTQSSKCKIKKFYWTEMERIYRCKICQFEDSSAYITSRHLIQDHDDVVDDLVEYLKERPAKESEPGRSLYDTVMEFSPPDGSDGATNEDDVSPAGLEQETGSVAITDAGSKLASQSKTTEGRDSKHNDPLDTVESVELLKRWLRLHISCQSCQSVISCRLFNQKGENTVHSCRQGKQITTLCDICGKKFSYKQFKEHWSSMHCSHEQTDCQYCGKMVRSRNLTHHIKRCHTTSNDVFECGICKKEFGTRTSRAKHEMVHQKEKPFKCCYCQRGFTQSSNMRYHMRQHTGERPYQCEKCTESFAHNVSLKNHLKVKHGIDPWKMGSVGD